MEQTNVKQTYINSIWFWWFLTTFVYTTFNSLGYPSNVGHTSILSYIAGLVGLFVPYGFWSLLLFFSPFAWLSLGVFMTLMVVANRELKKKNTGLVKGIILNLVILLVLTIIVDFVRYTPFESWKIFLSGNMNISSM